MLLFNKNEQSPNSGESEETNLTQLPYSFPEEPEVIKPALPFRRSLGSWLSWYLNRESWIYPKEGEQAQNKSHLDLAGFPATSDLRRLPLRAFLLTYEFDGFDLTTAKVTYPNHPEAQKLESPRFSKWLLVASFFGLPTRPIGQKSPTNENKNNVMPNLSFKQLMKNFIGGWVPLYHYEPKKDPVSGFITQTEKVRVWDINEKAIWQLLSLPIKIFLILPLTILRVLTKTAINVIKLFTEFLPMVVFPFCRFLFGVILGVGAFLAAMVPLFFAYVSAIVIQRILYSDKPWKVKIPLIALIGLPITLPCALFCLAVLISVSAVYFAFNFATKMLQIVARAIFSPEKSARMAFAAGRELKLRVFGFELGNVLGVLLAAISVGITAIAWMLLFPVLVGALVGYFPAVMQVVTTVLQWPVVATSLNAIQSGLAFVGAGLSTVFGPAITAIAGFLALKLSTAVMAFGATVGLFGAFVVTISSGVLDRLSNWWASRHEGGPVTWLLSRLPKTGESGSTKRQELEDTPTPRKMVESEKLTTLHRKTQKELDESKQSEESADRAKNNATSPTSKSAWKQEGEDDNIPLLDVNSDNQPEKNEHF